MIEKTLGFLTKIKTDIKNNLVIHSMVLIQVKTDKEISDEDLIQLLKNNHLIGTHCFQVDKSTPDSFRVTPMEILTSATLTKNLNLGLGGLNGYTYTDFVFVTIETGLVTDFSHTQRNKVQEVIEEENTRYHTEFKKAFNEKYGKK